MHPALEWSLRVQISLIVAVSLHVLSVVGWAGFTFAMARTGAAQIERLFVPQMGAAVTAVLSGAWLWGLTHRGAFGRAETVLAFGVACALLELPIQATTGAIALRRPPEHGGGAARSRAVLGQRISAGLLAFTLIAMAAARYV
jgi:hypothetical protein